jgi:hypothetical protein
MRRVSRPALLIAITLLAAKALWSDERVPLRVGVVAQSYTACAADSEIARITINLVVTVMNDGPKNLILSRRAETPIALGAMDQASGNVDEFRTLPRQSLPLTSSPPSDKFVFLKTGDSEKFHIQGWFLASRGKPIPGTIVPGEHHFAGILNLWPFDQANYRQLAQRWSGLGHLVDTREKLPSFIVKFEVKQSLNPCVN